MGIVNDKPISTMILSIFESLILYQTGTLIQTYYHLNLLEPIIVGNIFHSVSVEQVYMTIHSQYVTTVIYCEE